MKWEDLLAEFRALGGTADNLVLRPAPHGRGLFAVDPAQPVRLHVPRNLLIPTEEIEVRAGQLAARSSARVGDRERAFFDAYQRHFGWGAGALDALWKEQTDWAALPTAVKAHMRTMGVPENRFLPPSESVCLGRYLNARAIVPDGTAAVMPIMELINHAVTGQPYGNENGGLLVEGLFAGEVLVRYSVGDAWNQVTTYGFVDEPVWGHCLPCTHATDNIKFIIGRAFNIRRTTTADGIPIPQLTREGDVVRLSFLMLGYTSNMVVPFDIFSRLVADLRLKDSRRVFNVIHYYNRSQLITLLRLLAATEGRLVSLLAGAALNQLEAISAYC